MLYKYMVMVEVWNWVKVGIYLMQFADVHGNCQDCQLGVGEIVDPCKSSLIPSRFTNSIFFFDYLCLLSSVRFILLQSVAISSQI